MLDHDLAEISRFDDIVRITPPFFPDCLAAGDEDRCDPRVPALPVLGSERLDEAAPADRPYVCFVIPIGASMRFSVVEGLDDRDDDVEYGVSLADVMRRSDNCCASEPPLLFVIAARTRRGAKLL